jgi:hypothetical protein
MNEYFVSHRSYCSERSILYSKNNVSNLCILFTSSSSFICLVMVYFCTAYHIVAHWFWSGTWSMYIVFQISTNFSSSICNYNVNRTIDLRFTLLARQLFRHVRLSAKFPSQLFAYRWLMSNWTTMCMRNLFESRPRRKCACTSLSQLLLSVFWTKTTKYFVTQWQWGIHYEEKNLRIAFNFMLQPFLTFKMKKKWKQNRIKNNIVATVNNK